MKRNTSYLILLLPLLLSCVKDNDVLSQPPPLIPVGNPVIKKSYLALGDSYTVGQSLPREESFPFQLVSSLNAAGYPVSTPEIIATTGWTTANLLDATENKTATNPYDLVTLLIGVNNQYQGRTIDEYRQQFTVLLNRSIVLAGNKPAHVVVLSIPDYSVTPYASSSNRQKIAAEIDSFNAVNLKVSVELKVNYIDVTPESRKALQDASLIAGDGLHFSAREYGRWVDLMLPAVRQILK
jgi:lysophospholipase L1-like esterase